MSIREEDVSYFPVCPGCGCRDRVRRFDVGDGPAHGDAPLEACWCERCGSGLSAIPVNVIKEDVSER
jgi:hypothetical protein